MGKIFLVALTLAVFIGCGDTGPAGPIGPVGPAGPSTILAFGDINYGPTGVFSFGPLNRVDSVKVAESATGTFEVECWGSFPDETGTLIVSGSSDDHVTPNINVVGTIRTWGDTLITFQVLTWNNNTQAADGDDFSFVIFGE